MVGQRAARHARIGDHDARCAEARDKRARGAGERIGITNVAGAPFDRCRCEGAGDAIERLAPAREQTERGAARGVMTRQGFTDTRRGPGDEDDPDSELPA